jgi:hypothetical protein
MCWARSSSAGRRSRRRPETAEIQAVLAGAQAQVLDERRPQRRFGAFFEDMLLDDGDYEGL